MPQIATVLKLVAFALIVKTTAAVVAGYISYLPPDYSVEFLRGRKADFEGGYGIPFYAHIAVGPPTLLIGLLLLSDRFRRWQPKWHARLGRMQVGTVLFLLAPSGLWMAFYAAGGPVAESGFAALAVVTGATAWLGWRTAVAGRFAQHRRWMQRCYALLCSAVVIRLIGGALVTAAFDADWTYPASAWLCWLAPLGVLELCRALRAFHIPSTLINDQPAPSRAAGTTASRPAAVRR